MKVWARRKMAVIAVLSFGAIMAGSPAESGDAVQITDQRGKTVTLDGPAERVVTFPMPAAALFTAVNGGPAPLVAIHPKSKEAILDGILGTIYPATRDLESGITKGGVFNPNVEAVLALDPDLVVQWAGRGEALLQPLDAVGLNVIGLEYGTQDDTEAWIEMIARVVGKPRRAERVLGHHHDALTEIREEVARIPADRRVGVVYTMGTNEKIEVRGEGSYNHFVLDLVGGVNPAASAGSRVQINPEQLLTWNPEVILLGNFGPAVPADFYANPAFAGLDAVKNRRVYKVPLGGYRWDPPSQESPLMWMWLATLLYPERMDYDLRAEMRRFYKDVYDYALTEAEIDAILQMPLNEDNAGYARFAAG